MSNDRVLQGIDILRKYLAASSYSIHTGHNKILIYVGTPLSIEDKCELERIGWTEDEERPSNWRCFV